VSKTRVLVVDDSAVMRRIVTGVLSSDSELEVAATASNGKLALEKLLQIKPDIVTLDIEMPEMDGLETLAELRKLHPSLPVIMFSALTSRAASATLKALTLGASDYVAKPSNVRDFQSAKNLISGELIPKIKALCPSSKPVATSFARKPIKSSSRARPIGQIDVVAIGSSTGGPNALADILPQLAADFPVPIVIVQHMPPLFTMYLAKSLTKKAALNISEGTDGALLKAGDIWIAPGDHHMTVHKSGSSCHLKLNQDAVENACRPAVDVLFRSVAAAYGSRALGIVLTGMGHDGLRGCEAMSEKGAAIVAQDEATSVVWGMPRHVAESGFANSVVPIQDIASLMSKIARKGRIIHKLRNC